MPSTIPVWVTPAGSLGTIPEGVFYSIPLVAESNSSVYYRVIAGNLPAGMQINETGILSGNPLAQTTVQGVPQDVTNDVVSQFAVRAYTTRIINGATVVDQLSDRTFTMTVAGQNQVVWVTSPGNIATYYDGTQISGLTVEYTGNSGNARVSLVAGQLPPGLSITSQGVISGYITPNLTATVSTTDYTFTLRVTDGQTSDVRTFSILVYARATLTADNTHITADNTFVTADAGPYQLPVILTPTGSIGTTRSDNFFAFQFQGSDPYERPFQFLSLTVLPPGLTLDPATGWLYGYIPYQGLIGIDYNFSLVAQDLTDPTLISNPYDYSLTIIGPISSAVEWITPSDIIERSKSPSSLGFIDNGAVSTFYVKAESMSGLSLTYQLLSGSNSRLPQGLKLLSSGDIVGRVSFDTFCLDGGTTVFDVDLDPATSISKPTTFDMVCTFTVNATSLNGLINTNKTFSITVVRRYDEPFNNLYIQAMPPQNDRDLLSSLLQNNNIFPPDLIYRSDDPNFGVARQVIYNHAFGLTAATLDDYVASMNLNHYWKLLTLGEIKTARALDDEGNVVYEVVYSQVIDNMVNNEGISVSKQVVTPYVIDVDGSPTQVVYPNSLQNMRDQVIDQIGQISNVLPRWMLSRQADGTTLGFTPAWVLAYTKPGQSGQIVYNIQTQFLSSLNLVDFKADRYELDNYLTHNWDREDQHWIPDPPTLTTFDITGILVQWVNNINQIVQWYNNNYDLGEPDFLVEWGTATPPGTIFDGGSLQFIDPVDMYPPGDAYTTRNIYDKYLLYPKSNIIQEI
jgi:hypothetical protein